MYQHADSLPNGKEDENFLTKPELALSLIEKTLRRKYDPGLVLIDGGYGNNSSFLKELEKLKLNYIGGLAKNRLAAVVDQETGEKKAPSRLDEIVLCLDKNDFNAVNLELDKPKTVWIRSASLYRLQSILI